MPRKTSAYSSTSKTGCPGFNEAAARCHGKRTDTASPAGPARCFNEAAARCHGKRGTAARATRRWPGFNEAAARCHGKPSPSAAG